MYLTHPGHTGDAVLPMQATSKVHLSTSGPKRSDHWFDLYSYSFIDIDTLCQSCLTE